MGKKKITKENIKSKSISHKIFEEEFLTNKLGSRWITIDDLDRFYKKINLNYLSDTIRVHAQEILVPSEEQIQTKKRRASTR